MFFHVKGVWVEPPTDKAALRDGPLRENAEDVAQEGQENIRHVQRDGPEEVDCFHDGAKDTEANADELHAKRPWIETAFVVGMEDLCNQILNALDRIWPSCPRAPVALELLVKRR